MKSTDGKTMQPLCMAQHYQIFYRTYRRPGVNSDEQIILDRASSGDHIIVAHHNQFYSVPVRTSDRDRITEIELVQQLLRIMETKADPRTPPVGILTTMKRPSWAKAREELIKSAYDTFKGVRYKVSRSQREYRTLSASEALTLRISEKEQCDYLKKIAQALAINKGRSINVKMA